MDGLEDICDIKQALPGIGVSVLSVFSRYLEGSIAVGIDGYLLMDCKPEELIPALKRQPAIPR